MANQLRYIVIGNGEPLVLIHGLGSCKEAWEPQHALARHFMLIIPDLRGHGASPVEDKPLHVRQFALDVLHLLDELHIDRFHLCGLSMGGMVAQQIALMTNRVQSLILANTVSFVPHVVGEVFLQKKVHCFADAPPEAYTRKAAKFCVYNNDNRELLKNVRRALCFRKDSYIRTAQSLVGINFRHELKKIKVPTLLIGSQYDDITPVLAMVDMKRLIPRARLVVFRNAGHLSNLEVPDKFNRHVLEFLKNYNRSRRIA